MRTTRAGDVPPFLGADLTDRYARSPRAIDVCGLTPMPGGKFSARFWTWTWDAAPHPLDVAPIVDEIQLARVTMLDGPQGLARPPATMRVCERLTGAPGKTPHQRPSSYMPFAGYINSSLDLFEALHAGGVPISPVAGSINKGCGEVFPGDIWASLVIGLPKKGTPDGDRLRISILRLLGLVDLPASLTHDQNDAAVGALAAAALNGATAGFAAQLVGDPLYVDGLGVLREGQMVRLGVTSPDIRHRLLALIALAQTSAPTPVAQPPRPSTAPVVLKAGQQWSASDLHARFVDAVNSDRPVIASYSWVYSRLFGSMPRPWSQGHAQQVASIAHGTARSEVTGLGEVALDTFVVSTTTRAPSDGHWRAAMYQQAAWNRVFRGAQLLHGAARAPWEV
jgi:hypothetical protein